MNKKTTVPKNNELFKIVIWNMGDYVNAYAIKKNVLMFSSPIADKFCQEWNRVGFGFWENEIDYRPILKKLGLNDEETNKFLKEVQ